MASMLNAGTRKTFLYMYITGENLTEVSSRPAVITVQLFCITMKGGPFTLMNFSISSWRRDTKICEDDG